MVVRHRKPKLARLDRSADLNESRILDEEEAQKYDMTVSHKPVDIPMSQLVSLYNLLRLLPVVSHLHDLHDIVTCSIFLFLLL